MTAESLELPATAFDDLAAGYDSSFTTTRLGRWLRSVVWNRFDTVFGGRRRILDVGCGTGEDAIYLAEQGHQIVATDVSSSMLAVAREKARRAGCMERLDFRCVPMEELGGGLAGERFDGAYSNFGVINCSKSLESTLEGIARLLTPDSPLILVVMGRLVPWEWAWFLSRGDWRKAIRRLNHGGASWRGLNISYPSPGTLARAMPESLKPAHQRALGLVLPPSYAAGWLDRSARRFAMLARLETALTGWQALAALGDHYLMEARRLPASDDD